MLDVSFLKKINMMLEIASLLVWHTSARIIHKSLTLYVEDSCSSSWPKNHDFSRLEIVILPKIVSFQASHFDSSEPLKLCDWLCSWLLLVH